MKDTQEYIGMIKVPRIIPVRISEKCGIFFMKRHVSCGISCYGYIRKCHIFTKEQLAFCIKMMQQYALTYTRAVEIFIRVSLLDIFNLTDHYSSFDNNTSDSIACFPLRCTLQQRWKYTILQCETVVVENIGRMV